MKRPAFQFYPGDWQRDTALQSCSVGARGLWIEMICIMHQADPYGHLVINSRPTSKLILSKLVGASLREVARWLAELENAGVFTLDGEVIVSRRMIRDEAVRKARAEGGKLGGNPVLKDNHKVESKVNLHANLQPTPSSSSSSSKRRKTPLPPDFGISNRVATWCEKRGILNPEAHLEYFIGYVTAHGKQYADWDAALMLAIRGDWARAGDGRKRPSL